MRKQKNYKQHSATVRKKEAIIHKPSARNTNIAVFVILALTFIAYIPALKAGLVNWDDPDYVSNNPMIRNISNLEMLLKTPIQGNYHPLTVLSLAINYSISGFDAWSYHLLNLLFHLCNCYLVFRLALILSRNNLTIAFTTSLLFGIHPMHVESVAWVSERKDVLYSLFFLAGLISYTKYVDSGSKKQYGLTILLLVLSLLSKPAAVIFPVVLFCIDLLRNRKFNLGLMAEKIPFFILAFAMGLLTFTAQKEKGAIEATEIFDLSTRMLMGFYGIMMYFVKLIFPVNLSPFYPYAPINEKLPAVYYIAPFFSLLLIALVFYSLKRNRVIAFGILFYIANLLLVLQFMPVGSAIIAERYTYLPYIGIFYILGWLIDRYAKGNLLRSYYFNIPIAIILAILTFKQCGIWFNSATLWDHAIKTQPSARAYINRGLLYKEEKNYTAAIQFYDEAIKINVADHEAYANRGNVYFELNKLDLAAADYKKARQIKPDYVTANDNLGALFGMRRQYDSALVYFNNAVAINPRYANSYKNRALVYLELNRTEESATDFNKYLELIPNDPDIMNMVGVCYRNLARYKEAVAIIDQAINIKPDPHFYLNRAYCHRGLKDFASARRDVAVARQGGLQIDAELAKSLE